MPDLTPWDWLFKSAADPQSALSDSVIESWLLSPISAPPGFPMVMIEGTGPLSEKQLYDMLQDQGFDVASLDETLGDFEFTSEVLILGQADYHPHCLTDLINRRKGQTLKVYSHEMFLAFLALNRDPFDSPEHILERFATNHPALQFLSTLGFLWPVSVPSSGAGPGTGPEGWQPQGLLGKAGYTVAQNKAKSRESTRRATLQKVFTQPFELRILEAFEADYIDTWDTPWSAPRLQRIACELSWLNGVAALNVLDMSNAIRCREEDLDWLRQSFHHGAMAYRWPATQVP